MDAAPLASTLDGPQTRPMDCPDCWGRRRVSVCAACNHTGIGVDERLSPHFWLSDFVQSNKARESLVSNLPMPRQVANARRLCIELIEPVILIVHSVPQATSGIRSDALNPLIGGSRTSSHRYIGEADALDTAWAISRKTVMLTLKASGLAFDQAIYEDRPRRNPDGSVRTERWIHLSSRHHTGEQRRQLLMSFNGSDYLPFNPNDPRVQ